MVFRRKIKRLRAKSLLVWNQIRYIAEVLDEANLPAWNIQSIGSDFDGLVDPINMFWSSEDMPLLAMSLLSHAESYMKTEGANLKVFNQLEPEDIVEQFMHENARGFFGKWMC